MPVVFDHGKVFYPYRSLLPELRQKVIDEMEPDDRIRFTRCSKLSRKEARASKNHLYELRIWTTVDTISIFVDLTEFRGFHLMFEKFSETLTMRYFNLHWTRLWIEEYSDISDWRQFAFQHFKNLLQFYRNSVKSLGLSGEMIRLLLEETDFKLKSLTRLEKLDVTSDTFLTPFLAKLRRPLKELNCRNSSMEVFKRSDQIYSISKSLKMPHLQLDNEQFLRLSASNIVIHIGQLTVQNIISFIKSWQNGTLRDSFKRCEWHLSETSFNFIELFKVFGVMINDYSSIRSIIKHEKEVGKWAEVVYLKYMNALGFVVKIN